MVQILALCLSLTLAFLLGRVSMGDPLTLRDFPLYDVFMEFKFEILILYVLLTGMFYLTYILVKIFFRVFLSDPAAADRDKCIECDDINCAYSPERELPDKPLSASASPAFQFELWIQSDADSRPIRVGQGFRCGDHLITATHNLGSKLPIQIRTDSNKVSLPAEVFVDLGNDLSVATILPTYISALNLRSAKLVKTSPAPGTLVNIAAMGKGSTDVLQTDKRFGLKAFKGSTLPGFSGAPYFQGNTVYGMHVGSGRHNLAMDAAFIAVKLSHFKKDKGSIVGKRGGSPIPYVGESTEDYIFDELMDALEKGDRKVKVRQSKGDPMEWDIQIGDKFFDQHEVQSARLLDLLVQFNDMQFEEKFNNYSEKSRRKSKKKKAIYSSDEEEEDDFDYSAENYNDTEKTELSGMRDHVQDFHESGALVEDPGSSKRGTVLSQKKTQLPKPKKNIQILNQTHMECLPTMHAQRNEVLQSMLESPPQVMRGRMSQMRRSLIYRSLRSRSGSTQ